MILTKLTMRLYIYIKIKNIRNILDKKQIIEVKKHNVNSKIALITPVSAVPIISKWPNIN